jgi:monoamine oxidase
MEQEQDGSGMSRRELLKMIGLTAGSAAMYQAMTSLGYAAESGYRGPIKLEGDPKGASVLILGAGLAGMVAALELRQAGYKVKILEFNARAGGRNWSLRGGDTYTELGGATQKCDFDPGLYFNPGPWRIPFHHHALLDYCKRLGVKLEPFQQLNYNAYLHSGSAFGGSPRRIREIKSDFRGHSAELLAKVAKKGQLDELVTVEDREVLLEALRSWGALDDNYAYVAGELSSRMRGWESDAGGGLSAEPVASRIIGLSDILRSRLWRRLTSFALYEFQSTMFQPVGGMGRIGEAFAAQVGDLITYNAKVVRIHQGAKGVEVTYQDTASPGAVHKASGDWCICTIPPTILGQLDVNVGAPMMNAINAIPFNASVKIGLQFKRRFWEEDDRIYGGISYTDLPISQISYPSTDFNTAGKGVLLGGYTWNGANSFEFTAMAPQERVRRAVEYGGQIHPQYEKEFENGVAVAWHRVPFTLGCASDWTEEGRKEHYNDLCQIDGRIVLAGEHASYLPAWQEGAILSSLDAITRLHKRVLQG